MDRRRQRRVHSDKSSKKFQSSPTRNSQSPSPNNSPKPSPNNSLKPSPINSLKPSPINSPKPSPINSPKPSPIYSPKPSSLSSPSPSPKSSLKPPPNTSYRSLPSGSPRVTVSSPTHIDDIHSDSDPSTDREHISESSRLSDGERDSALSTVSDEMFFSSLALNTASQFTTVSFVDKFSTLQRTSDDATRNERFSTESSEIHSDADQPQTWSDSHEVDNGRESSRLRRAQNSTKSSLDKRRASFELALVSGMISIAQFVEALDVEQLKEDDDDDEDASSKTTVSAAKKDLAGQTGDSKSVGNLESKSLKDSKLIWKDSESKKTVTIEPKRKSTLRRESEERKTLQSESGERKTLQSESVGKLSEETVPWKMTIDGESVSTSAKESDMERWKSGVFEVDKESLASSQSTSRFVKTSRDVRNVVRFIKAMEETAKRPEVFVSGSFKPESGMFRPSLFKTTWSTSTELLAGVLNKDILRMLNKPRSTRSLQDINIIERNIIRYLECFAELSLPTRTEVARVCSLGVVTGGRTIVRQGYIASGYYFLMSGTLFVEVRDSGKNGSRQVGEMHAGSSFGIISLMRKARHGTTIVSKERSTFLRVERDDFRPIFRAYLAELEATRLPVLVKLPQFKNLDPETMKIFCQNSVLKDYAMNKVVYSPLNLKDQLMRFIVSGNCCCLRRQRCNRPPPPDAGFDSISRQSVVTPEPMEMGGRNKRSTFTFSDNQRPRGVTEDGRRRPAEARGKKLLPIADYDEGAYFGVGENTRNCVVISKTPVQLLMLPQSIYTSHLGFNSLSQLREKLDEGLPGESLISSLHEEDLRWSKYKQEVVDSIVKRQRRS